MNKEHLYKHLRKDQNVTRGTFDEITLVSDAEEEQRRAVTQDQDQAEAEAATRITAQTAQYRLELPEDRERHQQY